MSEVRTAVRTLTYGSYLRLDDVLGAQRPVSAPPAHDELMFIIVHQAYELWFKLLLHELTAARDAMLAGSPRRACELLDRCQVVDRLALHQLDLLDTLSPVQFRQFRPGLEEASGIQSTQFREIEFLSGWKHPGYVWSPGRLGEAERERLRTRLSEPSLWDGFLRLLAAAGFAVDSPALRRAALLDLASGTARRGSELWELAERLLQHDQAWSMWRGRHALMVERQIGGGSGTGGSSGVRYLRSRQHARFYPELWEVRGQL